MTEPTLQIAGYTRPTRIVRDYRGHVLLKFALTRGVTSQEERLAVGIDEFGRLTDDHLEVPVADIERLAEVVAGLNAKLAELESDAVKDAERIRIEQEKANAEIKHDEDKVHEALKNSGVPEIPPTAGRSWEL